MHTVRTTGTNTPAWCAFYKGRFMRPKSAMKAHERRNEKRANKRKYERYVLLFLPLRRQEEREKKGKEKSILDLAWQKTQSTGNAGAKMSR